MRKETPNNAGMQHTSVIRTWVGRQHPDLRPPFRSDRASAEQLSRRIRRHGRGFGPRRRGTPVSTGLSDRFTRERGHTSAPAQRWDTPALQVFPPLRIAAPAEAITPVSRASQALHQEQDEIPSPSIIPWNPVVPPKEAPFRDRLKTGIHGVQVLLGRPTPVWKRTMDILGASAGLLLLSPVFLVTAALIKTVSPGPIFFTQKRVGFRGKLFDIWKFRTMRVDADTGLHRNHVQTFIRNNPNAAMEKLKNDPRIIPMGRILRKTAIDELPQLFNVLRGEMSMVGPRPELPYAAQSYVPWATSRFDVIPGMTGLWQVSGKNRTTYLEMMRLDIRYIQRRTFFLDLKILLKTFPVVVGQAIDKTVRS